MRFDALMAVTFKITLLWDVMHLPDYIDSITFWRCISSEVYYLNIQIYI